MNLNESITDIRTHLLDPDSQMPNLRLVFLKLQDAAQLLHLEAQNTSTAWDVFNTTLTVSPGVSDYVLSAGFFGKDIRIITRDAGNPNHVAREIRRCDLQDIDQYYTGPEKSTVMGHSAIVMAFYRQGPSTYVKVIPTPAESKDYEIWYEGDLNEPLSLGDSPNIAPFQRYRNLKAAISLLPACNWTGMPMEAQDARRNGIALALAAQISDYEKAWRKYITSDRQDGVTMRIGYAENNGYDYL